MLAQSTAFEMPVTRKRSATVPAYPFTRVTTHGTPDPRVLAAWADLEAAVPCSIYQTRAWLLPWIETLGAKAGIAPVFVVARGADGAPVAMLCLGIRRHGLLRIAGFLGGKDANFNMVLARPGLAWTADALRHLLASAARKLGADRPDAFLFVNQPETWAGLVNPMTALKAQTSPSAAFGAGLPDRAEAFFASMLSGDTRKKLRKKEARLATLGPLDYRIAATEADRAAVIDAFFAQKLERFRAQGIVSGFDAPAMRRFVDAASRQGPLGSGIELHALSVGPRIVAVYGGAAHGGQWSGMFNSFDADPEIAKSSPGDLLLMRVIAAQCAAGRTHFDLGIGEARYKGTFCDDTIRLFDTFMPVTPRGRAFVGGLALLLRAKRTIKQHPRLFALAKRVRAVTASRR